MPQVFQVLRCYKCHIFQVYHTKKDNKWICKVCNEKQSIKRHYGIGTAKDCRIHVQKLNNLQSDKEASILNSVDSEDSDFKGTLSQDSRTSIDNVIKVQDNSTKKSKWSSYIEKEEISEINKLENIDSVKVYLELPKKRKLYKKNKSAKLAISSGLNESIDSDITEESITIKHCVDAIEKPIISNNKQLENISLNKNDNIQKFPVKIGSKWAHFVNENDNIVVDCHSKPVESNNVYKDINKCDVYHHKADDEKYNDLQQEQNILACSYDNFHGEVEIRSNTKANGNFTHNKPTNFKSVFSLCDDSELDNILHF